MPFAATMPSCGYVAMLCSPPVSSGSRLARPYISSLLSSHIVYYIRDSVTIYRIIKGYVCMLTYSTILFDLDGTLTDPKVGITRSIQHALARFSIVVDNLETLVPFIGPPLA